jgi:formate hydrogenlyase subunit 3/multisubunit Na+/H+ antiporter MnhD subunit
MALGAALIGAGFAAWGVLAYGPLAYVLSEGLVLRLDAWSALMTAASLALVLVGWLIGGAGYLAEADPGPARYGLAAALGVVAAAAAAAYGANLAFVVLALQLAGLSLAVLSATAGAHRAQALNASLRTLTAFGVAGVLGWFGVGLFVVAAGALDPAAALGAPLSNAAASGLLLVFVALCLAGLIAPLNHWGPSLFGHGPGLAGVVALTAIGPLLFVAAGRVVSGLFDLGGGPPVGVSLLVLGAASALVGGFQALVARDLRRLAGYAFAAQAGCALLSIALVTPAGAGAAALKIVAAGLGALLLASAGSREQDIARLDGLAHRAPVAALCAALGCLILMSAPFTIGYSASWVAVEAALARGWWPAAVVTVVVSLAGVVFGGRILERMFFRTAPVGARAPARAGLSGLGLVLLAFLAAAAGFAGAPLADLAEQAGHALVLWPLDIAL